MLKSVLPLGFVDFSLPGNAGDFSDRDGPGNDGAIHIANADVRGLLMPDAVASWSFNGKTYFATANEGDSRVDGSDEARIRDGDYDLDNGVFGADEANLKNDDVAGRLTVSNIDGDTDGDGKTYWQADPADKQPTLVVDFERDIAIESVRVAFASPAEPSSGVTFEGLSMSAGAVLPVRRASMEEVALHEARLERIAKVSGGKLRWPIEASSSVVGIEMA